MSVPIVVATTIGVLLTMAGLLAVRAAWDNGRNAQTIANYKEAASSWEATANALRDELANFKVSSTAALELQQKALAAATATIAALTVKVQVLEDTLTGHSAMVELATSVHTDIESLRSEIRLLAVGLAK